MTRKPANGSVRIIAGTHRGRILRFPVRQGLRPTADRLRETLFNWLAPTIEGMRCVDLFAGSGSLGIEALSRGASQVVFLEKDRKAADQLRVNLQTLGLEENPVKQVDALSWLRKPQGTVDLVFADPPFSLPNIHQRVIGALASSGILAPQAVLYLESPQAIDWQTHKDWQCNKSTSVGNVTGYLLSLSQSEGW